MSHTQRTPPGQPNPSKALPDGRTGASRRSYFPELDGVRAVAIKMVMLFHMAQQGVPIPGPVIIGQTGVDLFFVLSGFLITGILLKSSQNDWHEVRTFYVRRTLRIFPLYYASLLLLDLTGAHVPAAFWLYVQNFFFAAGSPIAGPNHFWSLAVEEQFYLVWPFIVLFLPRRHLVKALCIMISLALLCRLPLLHWQISPFYFTLSRIDSLAAGGLLAVLHSNGHLTRHRRELTVILLVSASLIAIEGKAAAHHPDLIWVQMTKFTVFAALYSSGIGLLLISPLHLVNRLLRSRPLRSIGRVAYGLYIFHPFVFQFVFARLASHAAILRASVAVVTTYACALVSWYGMERFFIRLKDKLAPERTKFPPEAPSRAT